MYALGRTPTNHGGKFSSLISTYSRNWEGALLALVASLLGAGPESVVIGALPTPRVPPRWSRAGDVHVGLAVVDLPGPELMERLGLPQVGGRVEDMALAGAAIGKRDGQHGPGVRGVWYKIEWDLTYVAASLGVLKAGPLRWVPSKGE
jgi:hypothetical protein